MMLLFAVWWDVLGSWRVCIYVYTRINMYIKTIYTHMYAYVYSYDICILGAASSRQRVALLKVYSDSPRVSISSSWWSLLLGGGGFHPC